MPASLPPMLRRETSTSSPGGEGVVFSRLVLDALALDGAEAPLAVLAEDRKEVVGSEEYDSFHPESSRRMGFGAFQAESLRMRRILGLEGPLARQEEKRLAPIGANVREAARPAASRGAKDPAR